MAHDALQCGFCTQDSSSRQPPFRRWRAAKGTAAPSREEIAPHRRALAVCGAYEESFARSPRPCGRFDGKETARGNEKQIVSQR